MKLIFTVIVGVAAVITHYNRFAWCNESSEEEDLFKNLKNCRDSDTGPERYCVSPHLCKDGFINMHGTDIIEIRLNDYDLIDIDLDDRADPCEEFLQRCCTRNDTVSSIPVNPNIKPNLQPDDNDDSDDFELPPPTCGINRPEGFIYRVSDKGIGQFGEFPWMVALLQRRTLLEKEVLQYFCGGSLIHPQVVLTAAHCVRDFTDTLDSLVVRLGEWDTVTENEPLKHQNLAIRKAILHENYAHQVAHNDVALLILDKQANLNVHINPICLPDSGENFDDQRCLVSGWGKENFNPEGKYAEVLKKIELPVIPRKRCKQLFRATSLGPFFNLHKSFMCAGGEGGVDTCKGDGGSPLACRRDDGAYVQAGIVAWGIGCGGANIPGAYVNVSMFVDWIAEKMQAEGM